MSLLEDRVEVRTQELGVGGYGQAASEAGRLLGAVGRRQSSFSLILWCGFAAASREDLGSAWPASMCQISATAHGADVECHVALPGGPLRMRPGRAGKRAGRGRPPPPPQVTEKSIDWASQTAVFLSRFIAGRNTIFSATFLAAWSSWP